MKLNYAACFLLLLFLFTANTLWPQDTSGMTISSTLAQNGDTLFIDYDSKVFVNQKLVVGKGTGNNGWYSSIGFKSALNWPTLLFKGVEERSNSDYEDNPQHRINDKVKMMLTPGDTLTIIKIKLRGSKKRGYYYTANLKSNQAFTPKFRCNLLYALKTKELLPEKEDE